MKSLKNLAAAALAVAAVLAPAVAAHAGANLMANGDFETGDFSGWDEFDDSDSTFVQLGDFNGTGPRDGQYQAVLGALNNGELVSHDDLAVDLGATYRLSFDLANDLAGANAFSFSFGAQHAVVCLHCDAFGYQHFSYDAQPVFPFETLEFDFFNAPSYFHLDNVSVMRVDPFSGGVPEPAGWALMIVGFAASGGALRAARRDRQIARA